MPSIGQTEVIFKGKIDSFQPKMKLLVPNKPVGRSFSVKWIYVWFVISYVGWKKSKKLIKCAIWFFSTAE